MQPGESRLEVQDTWYDPAASKVVPSGGQPTTRSDRLALWAGQLSGSVEKMREELRATRMSVFEAQQGMRDALDQVQQTQETLTQQVEVRRPALTAAPERGGPATSLTPPLLAFTPQVSPCTSNISQPERSHAVSRWVVELCPARGR